MDKIEIKKKQGSIVEALRDAILSGSIPADTEMTQNELAQSLGVSRMPVREALIILEYQGLIRRLPNNHVRVVPQTREYIAELFRMCGIYVCRCCVRWNIRRNCRSMIRTFTGQFINSVLLLSRGKCWNR